MSDPNGTAPPYKGHNPVSPTAAVSAAGAAASSLTGKSSHPTSTATTGAATCAAALTVEKIRRYVSASCGRCDYHLTDWTVQTPARREKKPPPKKKQESPPKGGPHATKVRDNSASSRLGKLPLLVTRDASEPLSAMPTSLKRAPSGSGEERGEGKERQEDQLGPLLEPDPSDLFPSHIKTTYLGPEHVLLFPNVDGARHFLGRSVLLDLKQDEEKNSDEEFEENGPGGGVAGVGTRPCDKVAGALLCPRCSFMLASSPTSPMLGLKGRFVVYKPSLRLTSTTDIPSSGQESSISPTNSLDSGDFVPPRPTHHDALPLIYDRKTFENILLRSAMAPCASRRRSENFRRKLDEQAGGFKRTLDRSSSSLSQRSPSQGSPSQRTLGQRRHSDGGLNVDLSDLDSISSEDEESYGIKISGTEDDEDNISHEDDDPLGTSNPAELVVLMVGQFWCPFSVSAVQRLSDYRRRQEVILHDKQVAAKGSGTAGGPRRGRSEGGQIRNGHFNADAGAIDSNAGNSKKVSPSRAHRRTASVPVTPNLFPANAAGNPTHKVSKSSPEIEGDNPASASNSARNATLRYPCTFLLLDSFYHGDRGGGIDPSQVLRPDLANDVKGLPIPCFLVWYRGCRVNVTNASQHFRCLKGAVIGLDLARYVDIVVPRIAAEARASFASSGLSTPSDLPRARRGSWSKFDGGVLGDLGSLWESTKSNDVVWADVEDVPDLDDRPVLHVKDFRTSQPNSS